VKDLPDMERLKSAKFTGLRWDIDPVVIEYFRYLLNDVVGTTTGRKNIAAQQAWIASSGSTSNRSLSLKSTAAMLTSDRRLSVDNTASLAVNSHARRRSIFRQFSTVQSHQPASDTNSSPPSRARARWKKVRH